MFQLEDSIADWRQQMLAAGVKSPVPLDELESHLRDDVEEQERSGLSTQQAFEAAVHRMGQAGEIRSEFETASSSIINPDQVMKQRIRNILVIIAVLATGMGLVLPAVAKWRAHEPLLDT